MIEATHLLDTSVYSQPLRKQPLQGVVDRWREIGDGHLAVSVLCEAEVLQGLFELGCQRLWELYRKVLEGRFPALPVDGPVAKVYARLSADARKAGQPRPVLDLLIAATAKNHRLILATCNPRHFHGIEGLAVEDWSAA